MPYCSLICGFQKEDAQEALIRSNMNLSDAMREYILSSPLSCFDALFY